MPRRKPRTGSDIAAQPRPRPSLRSISIALLTALLLLLALLQLRQPLDARICDTPRASLHPILCGTSTRECADAEGHAKAPRPLVVVAAGGSRAGSTWLFNALRILMRIRDPNTVSGWHLDVADWYGRYATRMAKWSNVSDAVETASRADAFRGTGTSLLVKLHLVQDWHELQGGGDADTGMEGHVDAVFTSHRDVREVVRSVRDMGWGVEVRAAKLAHPDFCKKRHVREVPKFLKSGQYRAQSVWVGQARATIKCRDALIESAGRKLKMDFKAESVRGMSREGTVKVLRELGKHLDYEYSEGELEAATEELGKLRAPKCDGGFGVEMEVNPVTHLHKGHVRFVKSAAAVAVERRGMQAISGDEVCARWLAEHGYAV